MCILIWGMWSLPSITYCNCLATLLQQTSIKTIEKLKNEVGMVVPKSTQNKTVKDDPY